MKRLLDGAINILYVGISETCRLTQLFKMQVMKSGKNNNWQTFTMEPCY